MPATIRSDPLNRRILNHGAALLSFFPAGAKGRPIITDDGPQNNPQQTDENDIGKVKRTS
jgi:hypothetical protein